MRRGGTGGEWLSTEEWVLLAELLFASRPRGIADVVAAVNPAPAGPPYGSRRWAERQQRLIAVFLHLYRRGLVTEAVAAGENTSDVYQLTSAGQRAATGVAQLWRSPATSF